MLERGQDSAGRTPQVSVIWVALSPDDDPWHAVDFVERLGLSAVMVRPPAASGFPEGMRSGVRASLADFQRHLPLYFGAPEDEVSFLDFDSLPESIRNRLRDDALTMLQAASSEQPIAIVDPWAPFTLEFWLPLVERTAVLFWLTPPASNVADSDSGDPAQGAHPDSLWIAYWRATLQNVAPRFRVPVDAAAVDADSEQTVARISNEIHKMGFADVLEAEASEPLPMQSPATGEERTSHEGKNAGFSFYRAMIEGEILDSSPSTESSNDLPTRRFDLQALALQLPDYLSPPVPLQGRSVWRRADAEEVDRYWARRFSEFRREIKARLEEERSAIALSRRQLERLSEKLRARARELKQRNRELYRLTRSPLYRWLSALPVGGEEVQDPGADLQERFLENEGFARRLTEEVGESENELAEFSAGNGKRAANALSWQWKPSGERQAYRLTYLRSCTDAPSLRVTPPEEEIALAPEPEDVDAWLDACRGLRARPRISLLIPIHATPPGLLLSMLQSVFDQIYDNWEMCLAIDGATGEEVCTILTDLEQAYPEKVRTVRLEGVPGIVAGSNAAADRASGDFIALLDHDDVLTPDALLSAAVVIDRVPDADLIYSDEDKLTENGRIAHPFYKPDFSPELLDSFNYITHFTVIRRSLFEDVGRFRLGFDGSQDYDLILRASERARRVEHIPRVLYHWRMVPGSTAAHIAAKGDPWREASFRALRNAVQRRGEDAVVEPGRAPDTYRIKYAVDPEARVTIIIPTKDNVELLRQCVGSIQERTAHRAFEILVISNNTERPEALSYLEQGAERGDFRYVRKDGPFNYSALNNLAVRHAESPYVLFLNDDTEVIEPDWLTAMLEHAQRPPIGVVGARLLFEDRTVQHAGLIVGCGGVADHAFRGAPEHSPGYFNNLRTVRNCSAVTGACMLVRKDVYEEVGGMDEALACAFNDVDFCLRVRRAGYRNVFTPYAELFHFESKSRGYIDSDEKMRQHNEEADYIRRVWGESIFHDPCYNPNLSLVRNDYTPRTPSDREVELTYRLKPKVFS